MELRTRIYHELADHERQLKEIIQWSPAETVDEIAARHPEHANTIRQIVVRILRDCETEAPLHQRVSPNTYMLMLKQIGLARSSGQTVHVLTFNYDRSLQFLLHRVNAIEPPERKLDPTIVTPIFGRLGPLAVEDSKDRNRRKHHHEYGHPKRRPIVHDDEGESIGTKALLEQWKEEGYVDLYRESKIHFIGESSAPRPDLGNKLAESDQIFFLGVGYHAPNMEILGLDFKKKQSNKFVAGTGLGMDRTQISSLLRRYPAIATIETCDAYSFLKNKFNIADPTRNRKMSRSVLREVKA